MPFQISYSLLDRLIHRLAFGIPGIQLTAADIEQGFFGALYEGVEPQQPIFVTSLPRAGTTLLLEALHQFPSLATQTYRDMPFVLAPVFWARLSGPFRQQARLRERAHGDHLQIGYDSPEAFEEILWRTFWPEKFAMNRIELWGEADLKADAFDFFMRHMKKIIALRRPERSSDGRYLSKNNGNIARLDLILRMFPAAKILIPVRSPVEQAFSLWHQHQKFTKMHMHEPFVSRYMADLGHYEFGRLHRPFAFPGLDLLVANRDPSTLDYWLGYWVAAFDYVLARREKIILISYEETSRDGRRAMAKLCSQLNVSDEGILDKVAAVFRSPSPLRSAGVRVNTDLRDRAEELHELLLKD